LLAAKSDFFFFFSFNVVRDQILTSNSRYDFGVLQPGTMETTPVTCKALVSANTNGTLPDVTDGTCEESSRTWTIIRGNDGLTFTVSQPVTPSSNQTGSYLIPNSDLVMSNQPNAVVQSYDGPTSFDLSD
jgi:hypothetical protein